MQPGLRRFSPVAMTVIGIILTLIMLINSLETSQQIFAIPVAIVPSQITFASYIEVFQTQLPHLVTSLVISIGTALLAIVIATPAAYGLAHFRFRVTLLIVFC